MIVVRTSGHLLDRQIQYPVWESKADVLQHYVQDLNVGGVIFLGGSEAQSIWSSCYVIKIEFLDNG